MKLDLAGFEKQVEQLKKKIGVGVIEGLEDSSEYLKDIMQFYIHETVYAAYNPVIYERTYDLLNNVTSTIIGNALYVYVDDSGMDKPNGQWSYPWRVILGDDFYPYDFPKENANFMNQRDWRFVTKEELLGHMNQSKILLDIVKKAIQRRI